MSSKPENRQSPLARTLTHAAVLLSSACGVADERILMTPEPTGIVSGGFSMPPLPKPRAPVQQTSDGRDDPQLQQAMKMAGARSFTVVREGQSLADAAAADERSNDASAAQLVGVVTKRGHYLLRFDGDQLASRFAGMVDKVAEPGAASVRGWSNGIDSRSPVTAANVPVEQGIVWGAGQCSGALIGRRIVRTAAHCVIAHNTGGGTPVGSVTFESRRSGGTVHATDSTSYYFYGGAYIGNGCGRSTPTDSAAGYRANWTACTWADWAMLILDTNWYSEAGWISWYGYQGLVSGDLGAALTSGGYPGCDDFLNPDGTNNEGQLLEDPAGCRTNPRRFYQDTSSPCAVSSFLTVGARFKSGCDISPGNSGGPVIRRDTPYLIGHAEWQDCGTCSAATPAPNTYLGHDDWLFNLQNELRADYP